MLTVVFNGNLNGNPFTPPPEPEQTFAYGRSTDGSLPAVVRRTETRALSAGDGSLPVGGGRRPGVR